MNDDDYVTFLNLNKKNSKSWWQTVGTSNPHWILLFYHYYYFVFVLGECFQEEFIGQLYRVGFLLIDSRD